MKKLNLTQQAEQTIQKLKITPRATQLITQKQNESKEPLGGAAAGVDSTGGDA